MPESDLDAGVADAAVDRFLDEVARHARAETLTRLLLTKPRGGEADPVRVAVRSLRLHGEPRLSFVHTERTRDLTHNHAVADGLARIADLLRTRFAHGHLWAGGAQWELRIGKRGRATMQRVAAPADTASTGDAGRAAQAGMAHAGSAPAESGQAESSQAEQAPAGPAAPPPHDRAKHRAIGLDRPFLAALGVTDAQQRLIPAMARKYRQINKFIEVLGHAIDEAALPPGAPVRVADFGSGKGYLTFAVHDHLTRTLGREARVTGVELRPDMVALCESAARRLNLDGLHFELGDVRERAPEPVDVMIALHACDTATDHAIHHGIRAGAAIVMCSPCCHKQLRPQMCCPRPLHGMLQHGIHLGQQAEMVTDSLRALLLEAQGYRTQVFEFVALEHTSKNKMILAVKRPEARAAHSDRREAALAQVREIKDFYGIREHALEVLLAADAAV